MADDELVMQGTIDGNAIEMKRAQPFLRRKPIRAMQMLAPFVVQNKDAGLTRYEVGDFLCEQDGVRWGVKAAYFAVLYAKPR